MAQNMKNNAENFFGCTDLESTQCLVKKGHIHQVNEIPLKSPQRHLVRHNKNKAMSLRCDTGFACVSLLVPGSPLWFCYRSINLCVDGCCIGMVLDHRSTAISQAGDLFVYVIPELIIHYITSQFTVEQEEGPTIMIQVTFIQIKDSKMLSLPNLK